MSELAPHVDWNHIKKVLKDIELPLKTVCDVLPAGLPKTICCSVVAGLEALIAMLPNE